MKLELAEHLRELFKDELCKLGSELGLSHEMICRHLFQVPDSVAEAAV